MSPAPVFLKVPVRLTIMVSSDNWSDTTPYPAAPAGGLTGWRGGLSGCGGLGVPGRNFIPLYKTYALYLRTVSSLALAKYIKAFQTLASFFTSFPP